MLRSVSQSTIVRRFVLIIVPLALALLELTHPVDFGKDVFHGLLPQVDWFLTLHLLQLPLFGLMALAGAWLVTGINSLAATVARLGMGIFAIAYTAHDSVAGIATALLIRHGATMGVDQQPAVAQAVQALFFDPLTQGSWVALSRVGAIGWIVGLLAAGLALAQAGRVRWPLVFLVPAAFALFYGHPAPWGTIAFGSFCVAALGLEFATTTRERREQVVVGDKVTR